MIRAEKRAVALVLNLAASRQHGAATRQRPSQRRILSVAFPGKRAESSAAYYDQLAERYDRLYDDVLSRGEDAWVRARLRTMVGDGDQVLDLGCGTGLGLELLSGVGTTYVGYDISPAMIGIARRKFAETRGASFCLGDMARIADRESERFDAVISLFGSFSHGLDPQRTVGAIRQVCRPGGRVLVMAYSRLSLRNLVRCVRERRLDPAARYQDYRVRNSGTGECSAPAIAYRAGELKALFAGFEDVKVTGLNAIFELAPAKSFVRARLRDPAAARRALDIESRLLRPVPSLCHMLVVTATKPV